MMSSWYQAVISVLGNAKTTKRKETVTAFDSSTAKFVIALAKNMPALSGREMETLTANPDRLKRWLQLAFKPALELDVSFWETYYNDHFGIRADFSKLATQRYTPCGKTLLIMHEKVSCAMVGEVYMKRVFAHKSVWHGPRGKDEFGYFSHQRGGSTYAAYVHTRPLGADLSILAPKMPAGEVCTKQPMTTLTEELILRDVHLLRTGELLPNVVCGGSKCPKGIPEIVIDLGGRVDIRTVKSDDDYFFLRYRPVWL